MDMITVDYRDRVAIAGLNRGVTNPLNLELVNRLTGVLEEVKNDPQIHGLVLTGTNEKFFSIGWDIPGLYGLSMEAFAVFFRAFNRLCLDLYTFPKPTTAAITGHAVAGGCILAICCDYRIIADGKKWMGLNEIKLGVPIPYPADCILRSVVGVRYARDIVQTGDFYLPGQSLQMGLVDRVVPPEQVQSKAIEKAKSLGSLPQQAFAMIKHDHVEATAAEARMRLEEKEKLFLACWYSDEARSRLKEAMEKF